MVAHAHNRALIVVLTPTRWTPRRRGRRNSRGRDRLGGRMILAAPSGAIGLCGTGLSAAAGVAFSFGAFARGAAAALAARRLVCDIFVLKIGESFAADPVDLLGDQLFDFGEMLLIGAGDDRDRDAALAGAAGAADAVDIILGMSPERRN